MGIDTNLHNCRFLCHNFVWGVLVAMVNNVHSYISIL